MVVASETEEEELEEMELHDRGWREARRHLERHPELRPLLRDVVWQDLVPGPRLNLDLDEDEDD